MNKDSHKVAYVKINHIGLLISGFVKIAFVLFCAFVLIVSIVYHWEFPPYLLKILGAYITAINIFAIIRKYLSKTISNETAIYACNIKNDTFGKVLYFVCFLVVAGLFCVVDILLGVGILLYLLRLLESYYYYKVKISQNFLILYHRLYGKISYQWEDIRIICSLDETMSRYFYIHLSESYYLDIWYKGALISVVLNRDENTIRLYEYIKDFAKK